MFEAHRILLAVIVALLGVAEAGLAEEAFLAGSDPRTVRIVERGSLFRMFTGDVDGDGFDDLILSVPQTEGSTGGSGEIHILLSRPVWPALWDLRVTPPDVTIRGREEWPYLRLYGVGDLNGDGRDDLIFGDRHNEKVGLLFGRDDWPPLMNLTRPGPDVSILPPQGGEIFPTGVGDVLGDAVADLVLTESEYQNGRSGLMVLEGGASWPSVRDLAADPAELEILLDFDQQQWGLDIFQTPIGDLNDDGTPDLALSYNRLPAVIFGRALWPPVLDLSSTGPDLTLSAAGAYSLGIAPVIGSAAPDLLIFDDGDDSRRGKLRVLAGSPNFGTEAPALTVLGAAPGDADRVQVTSGEADMDRDGTVDILLGFQDAGWRNRQPAAGSVRVLLGPFSPGERDLGVRPADLALVGAPDLRVRGPIAAGDLDRDGRMDLVAGVAGDQLLVVWFGLDPTPLPAIPDVYVDAHSGSDARDGRSWDTALKTIGAAMDLLDVARGPSTVHVAEGTYREAVLLGRGVSLQGSYPAGGGTPDIQANTSVIDAEGVNPSAVRIRTDGGEEGSRVQGFRITGGGGAYTYLGGGVRLEYGQLDLTGNQIIGNHVVYTLRGVKMNCPGAVYPHQFCIRTCTGLGGGVYVGPGGRRVEVTNNLIRGNAIDGRYERDGLTFDEGDGCRWGGVSEWECDLPAACPHDLYGTGRGIYVSPEAGETVISGNTITDNTWTRQEYYYDYWWDGGADSAIFATAGSPVVLSRNILWDAYCVGTPRGSDNLIEAGSDQCPSSLTALTGDPLFVDRKSGDYHLSQLAAGQPVLSPAVDAGSIPASEACLPGVPQLCMDLFTTRTDGASDVGRVDLGYHYPALLSLRSQPIPPPRMPPVTLESTQEPRPLP